MTEYTKEHITKDKIKNWLFTLQSIDSIFQDYFMKNGEYYPIQSLYELPDKNSQNSIDYIVNNDFLSLNSDYRQLEAHLDFSETDWIHPFSDVSIHRHPRYLLPFKHHHAFFELCYVLSGSCTQTLYCLNGTHTLDINDGDLLIIPPGSEHSILMNSDGVVVNILIRKSTFKTAFLNTLPHDTVLYNFFCENLYEKERQNYIIYHTGNDNNLQSIFYGIAEEYCNNDIYSNHIINQLLSIFISTLLRCHGDSIEFIGENSRCLELIPSILQYMELNYNTTSIQDISNHFNFNTTYLSQIFKEYTGNTLIGTLINIRIAKACKLLETTSLPIELVAEMTGYTDTTYFIRLFKKYKNQTPLQYRKSFKY